MRPVRLLVGSIGVCLIAFASTLTPASADSAAVPAVKACIRGGYQTLVRSDGTSFGNPGQCVAYAVRGGTLFRELDASSVYTAVRGAGGPAGPPDANGDSTGGSFDGGVISGGFSIPAGCVPNPPNTSCFNFSMQFQYVLHTTTDTVEGTGTAACNPCSVGGLNGTVRFTTTVVGDAVEVNGLFFPVYEGGTWQITSGTDALGAISGSGTWTPGPDAERTFAGQILIPVQT